MGSHRRPDGILQVAEVACIRLGLLLVQMRGHARAKLHLGMEVPRTRLDGQLRIQQFHLTEQSQETDRVSPV